MPAIHPTHSCSTVSCRCLLAWAAHARRRLEMQRRLKQHAARRRTARLRACFHGWRTICLCAAARRRRLTDAAFYHAFVTLSNCIAALKAHASRKAGLRRQCEAAALHWWRSVLGTCLTAWCHSTAEALRKTVMQQVAERFRWQRLAQATLAAWCGVVAAADAQRQQVWCQPACTPSSAVSLVWAECRVG